MKVRADKTYPGRRYFTPQGNLVEVALDLRSLKDHCTLHIRRAENLAVVVYPINHRGLRTTETFPSTGNKRLIQMKIPPNMILTDARPKPETRPGKHGPPKKGDHKWWGWADDRPELCERLLSIVADYHGFVVPRHHYFRMGYQGRTFASLFRNGMLGFIDVPEELSGYPLERWRGKIPKRDYLSKRIMLEAVVIQHLHHAFDDHFEVAFKKFVAQIDRKGKKEDES